MSFETISLLQNWLELGVLSGMILFRLARMFDLIACTQRELTRAIHHPDERHTAELGINGASGRSEISLVARSARFRAATEMS
jgi:hypothetical protein